MTLKLLQAYPRRLLFSPYAWAKVKWFFMEAGDLEMSGFGISDPVHPLFIMDFQTIRQEVDGTNTEIDAMSLNKYIGDMAKKEIPPCRCARVWIHSHPFAKTAMPGPSVQDRETFKDKICDGWNTDWGAMVIVGGNQAYCEIFTEVGPLGGYSRFQIPVEVDWMTPIMDENDIRWEKEFKKNVVEAEPEPVPILGAGPPGGAGLFNWSQAEENMWIAEWMHTPATVTNLSRKEWIMGRAEGYQAYELIQWGKLCVHNSPENLRKSAGSEAQKHNKKLEKILARKAKKAKEKKGDVNGNKKKK